MKPIALLAGALVLGSVLVPAPALATSARVQRAATSAAPLPHAWLYRTRYNPPVSGEPVVHVGLADGQTRVVLKPAVAAQLVFHDGNTWRTAAVPAKTRLQIELGVSQAAARQWMVDVGPGSSLTTQALGNVNLASQTHRDKTAEMWRRRQLAPVDVLDAGALLQFTGGDIYRPRRRVRLLASSAPQARNLAARLRRRFGKGPKSKRNTDFG